MKCIIEFKLASLAFNAVHTDIHLTCPVSVPYRPCRVLRSSFSADHPQVSHTNVTFRYCCFHTAAPTISNTIHSCDALNSFWRHLKLIFYQHPTTQTPAPPIHLIHVTIYTHTFNGTLSGTTRVSRYQKGKTDLDFTEARDSE